MSNNTTNTRHLQIDGMTGDACVQKVTSALNSVKGVATKSVQVGSATITCDDLGKSGSAIAALNSAGYKARESLAAPAGNGTPGSAWNGNNTPENATTQAGKDMANEGAGGAIGGNPSGANIGSPPHVVTPGKSSDAERPASV